jgi:gluconate 2-dehydrogenase gamma chain
MSNDHDGNALIRPEVVEPRSHLDSVAQRRVSRRGVLIGGASAAGGLAAGALALPGALAQEATPAATAAGGHGMAGMAAASPTNEGFTFFVPYQAAIIRAAAARLIPSDELGPGAEEAGVVYFIDRELASAKSYRGRAYEQGPFHEGAATQGDQSGLDMDDRFRLGIEGMDAYAQQLYGQGFASLASDQQDRILSDMEQGIPDTFGEASIQSAPFTAAPSGTEASIATADEAGEGAKAFFDLVLAYTLAGFFADPVHGGNRDMVGWKLIGFPGAHIGYRDQILDYGQPFTGPFISLGQYQQQVSGGA